MLVSAEFPFIARYSQSGWVITFSTSRMGDMKYLFPGLKPGGPDGKRNWYFTKAFTSYRRAVGVTRERVSFHSLRKNAVKSLERAGVHESQASQIVGHERAPTIKFTVHGASLCVGSRM